MELVRWLVIYTIPMAILLPPACGHMFRFLFVSFKETSSKQEQYCKNQGYDGLAVVSSPEALAYAVELAKRARVQEVYIGAHYQPASGIVVWDDGTVLRSDSPLGDSLTLKDPAYPYAQISITGQLWMRTGNYKCCAICGNYKNLRSESGGYIHAGGVDANLRKVLSASRLGSLLECAVLCGMNYACRAAEFNSGSLTCTLIGEYRSKYVNAGKSQVLTYMRTTFP